METKFTLACCGAGDWSVTNGEWRNTAYRALTPNFDSPLMKGEVIVFVAEGFNRDIESAMVGDKADAVFNLIAAAPTMYKELAELLERFDPHGRDVTFNGVRAALAKARGE